MNFNIKYKKISTFIPIPDRVIYIILCLFYYRELNFAYETNIVKFIIFLSLYVKKSLYLQ